MTADGFVCGGWSGCAGGPGRCSWLGARDCHDGWSGDGSVAGGGRSAAGDLHVCARSCHGPVTSGSDGSAVVEFVLVSIIVVVLLLAVVQLGVALHIRNTLIAAAGEGARFAASADREPSDGAAHTRRLIQQSLPDSYADDVAARYSTVDGVQTVEVEVVADLPVFGWIGAGDALRVIGHAMEES